ncbi:hypothetical protein Tco_0000481 [Tanacetum coccineum]
MMKTTTLLSIDLGYLVYLHQGIQICLWTRASALEELRQLAQTSEGRGNGSLRKKTTDTTEESVEVSDESDPEPLIRRKTSKRKVVKKKASILVDDNIIPEPDIALELGKYISLAEAEEEAVAREVHDTHARIVTESVPRSARP